MNQFERNISKKKNTPPSGEKPVRRPPPSSGQRPPSSEQRPPSAGQRPPAPGGQRAPARPPQAGGTGGQGMPPQRYKSQAAGGAPSGGGTGQAPRQSNGRPVGRVLTPAEQKRLKAARRKRRAIRAGIIAGGLVLVLSVVVLAGYISLSNRISGRNTQAGTVPIEQGTAAMFPDYAGKGIVNFLVCGIAYDDDDPTDTVGNTDMILYCHYDTVNNKVAIMQIPRDVFVGAEVETGGTYKINGLYRNATDSENRVAALTAVLADQFKLPVDFYVTIDMAAVREIVDIKGGLDVYVPVDIDDTRDENAGTMIPQGWHRFNGTDLEVLLRNRYSAAYNQQYDIARLRTQQYVYSALYREFTSLAPQDLIMWMDVLTYRVKTDNDLMGLGSLATKALQLQGSDITMVRPACGAAMYEGSACVSLVAEEMADVLNTYFRAEGQVVTAAEMDVQELPMSLGVVETEIKTMTDIQSTEAPA